MTSARAAFLLAAVFLAFLVWDAAERPEPIDAAGRAGEAGPGAGGAEQILYRALGAFRVFAVDALWLRMSSHMSEGRDGLVLADARTLLALEPGSDEIRDFLHWHLAFNVAQRAATPEERRAWINEGLDVIEEGLRADPDSAVLNSGIGTTFFMITDRNDEYAEVCHDRYGRRPVELAHIYLERAFCRSRDPRTLAFLLQSLENAAHCAMEESRFAAARLLWDRAAGYASKDLATLVPREKTAELADFYRAMEERCARAEQE